MTTFSEMDLGTLPYLSWSSLQQLVMVGLTTNGQQYLHVAAVTQPSLKANLKSEENGHALKAASDMLSFFVDMFLRFFKNAILSVSLTFCFILEINYKNENWFIVDFIFWDFINRSNHQICSEKCC